MSGKDVSHQDWNPIVLRGATGKSATKVHSGPKPNPEAVRLAKLDGTDDVVVVKPKELDPECKAAMIRARVDKKLTQKELNTKLSLPPGMINDIEAGRKSPNPKQMTDIGRELGITLRYAK